MRIGNRLSRMAPRFWRSAGETDPHQNLFNYRHIWLLSVGLLSLVTLVPLGVIFVADYQITQSAIQAESVARMTRLTSNTRRTIGFFLEERLAALQFTVREETTSELRDPERLSQVLRNLKSGFGGFIDLGLINGEGIQVAYAGPYELLGRSYADQTWFLQTMETGSSVSDTFLGYRKAPHMTAAVRIDTIEQGCCVLRATLDGEYLFSILSALDLSDQGDAFLVNREGVIQSPSRFHGGLLEKLDIDVPPYNEHTQVVEVTDREGNQLQVGYAFIKNSPLVLMLVSPKADALRTWFNLRQQMLWFFVGSVIAIVLALAGISSYMVNRVYEADQTRLRTLHQMEHTSRLASIGRLAAGVAHEINNPLAIINEKAGLMRDLFEFKEEYAKDDRLLRMLDSITASVERCGTITKQLLSFARHFEVDIKPVNLGKLIEDVLSFLRKEAEYRGIAISVNLEENLPEILTDRGTVQQILVNLVNNALQAMHEGGRLDVVGERTDEGIKLTVSDTGCGIAEENLKRIFEPFFTTKKGKGGTGLGLSITYGLVKKLHGKLDVQSELGKGTTFSVVLPLAHEEKRNEGPTCG